MLFFPSAFLGSLINAQKKYGWIKQFIDIEQFKTFCHYLLYPPKSYKYVHTRLCDKKKGNFFVLNVYHRTDIVTQSVECLSKKESAIAN